MERPKKTERRNSSATQTTNVVINPRSAAEIIRSNRVRFSAHQTIVEITTIGKKYSGEKTRVQSPNASIPFTQMTSGAANTARVGDRRSQAASTPTAVPVLRAATARDLGYGRRRLGVRASVPIAAGWADSLTLEGTRGPSPARESRDRRGGSLSVRSLQRPCRPRRPRQSPTIRGR